VDIQGTLAFIGGLSLLVLVHELGHFAVAKAVGIRVENFSIFMGQPLLAIRRASIDSDPERRWQVRFLRWSFGLPDEQFQSGETEYAFRWIPFGGYVKMSGQSDMGEADVEGNDWEFTSKSIGARAAVVAAGPIMNFVLAVVLFAGLNVAYGVIGRIGIGPAPDMLVTEVVPGSPADAANVTPGSHLVAINGMLLTTWEALGTISEDDTALILSFAMADGDTIRMPLEGGFEKLYDFGVSWEPRSAVGSLIPLEPATEAGLRVGDTIVAIDDEIVTNWSEMSYAIRRRPGRDISVSVMRDGRPLTLVVVPSTEIADGGAEDGVKLGPVAAIGTGFAQTWDVTVKIIRFLERLVTRAISPKFMAGPVGIFQMSGIAAQQGIATYLAFLAVLSANLAVVNLLPLAVLDGGHLVFFAFEAATGKRPSPKQQGFMQQVGIVMLLLMLVMVTVNDLSRLF
jgi:regulator of sigma E protease